MAKKVLAIFYYGTLSNEEIIDRDSELFFGFLEDNHKNKLKENGIELVVRTPKNASFLYRQIDELVNSDLYEEVYLHFSGHGETTGIYFDKWLLSKQDYANFLNHDKIKFCFFSSCNSNDLSKLVFEKSVPIVIGIDGKIGNEYAIAIQKKMYQHLINGDTEKRTFLNAFHSAISETNTDKQKDNKYKTIQRGGGSLAELKEQMTVELKILINSEAEEKKCLIYPTVIDALPHIEAQKQIVWVYTNEPTSLDNFITAFEQQGYSDNHDLSILKENDLKAIAKKGENAQLSKSVFERKIKFLIIFHSKETIPIKATFKTTFTEKLLTDTNFQYGIAFNKEKILDAEDFLEEMKLEAIVDNLEEEYTIGYEDTLENLVAFDEFYAFLNDSSIDLGTKKRHIFNLPFKANKKELKKRTSSIVRFFFAPRANQYFIYFLINWIKKSSKFETPLIICNNYDAQSKDLSIKKLLELGIEKNYPSGNKTPKLSRRLLDIIEQRHVIILITKQEVEELKKQIQDVLTKMDASAGFLEDDQKPSYIFCINEVDLVSEDQQAESRSFFKEADFDIIEAKSLAKPKALELEKIISWADDLSIEDDHFQTLVNLWAKKLLAEHKEMEDFFNKWKEQLLNPPVSCEDLFNAIADLKKEVLHNCPSNLVSLTCDGFEVPQKQIMHIS